MRALRYILVAGALVVIAYAGLRWFGQALLRTLMMTTADPDTLGLVVSDSMQPVTLKLVAKRMFQAPSGGPDLPTDQLLGFKIPAAYVYMIDLKEAPSGSQRLGFEVWSRTFDPVSPDRIADKKNCGRSQRCLSAASSRMGERLAAGERPLLVEVTNVVGTPAHRREILPIIAGLTTSRPCKITEDVALGMTVLEAPEGTQPKDACNFIGNPGVRTKDGKIFPPKHFLKFNADGTPKFSVTCKELSTDQHDEGGSKCLLTGYFGVWPVVIWLPGGQINSWNEIFERAQQFIVQHVVETTN